MTTLATGCGDGDTRDDRGSSAPISFELIEDDFVALPGVDNLHCVRMQPPPEVGDEPLYVTSFESEAPPYTHHLFMGYEPFPVAPVGECDGPGGHDGNDGKFLFSGGVGRYSTELPDGYGLYLEDPRGHFVAEHHALNTGTEPATMWGRFRIGAAPAEAVTYPLNVLACVIQSIRVPPRSEMPVSGTCIVPFDVDLVMLSSHAHQFLTRFETRIFDGERTTDEVIYTNDDWDSPRIDVLDEPVELRAGQGITFTCHFSNPTDHELTWGAGDFGEMCSTLNAYAFPAGREREAPPSLGSVIGSRPGEPDWCTLLGPDCCSRDICDAIDTTDLAGPF